MGKFLQVVLFLIFFIDVDITCLSAQSIDSIQFHNIKNLTEFLSLYMSAFNNNNFEKLNDISIKQDEYNEIIKNINLTAPNCLQANEINYNTNELKGKFDDATRYHSILESMSVRSSNIINGCAGMPILRVDCSASFKNKYDRFSFTFLFTEVNNEFKLVKQVFNDKKLGYEN